jgi:hypothetical protein
MQLIERVRLYNDSDARPRNGKMIAPPLHYWNEYIYGMWNLGNDYRSRSTLYGSYPNGYLKRISTMFPDKKDVLHLCSGTIPAGNYFRIDLVKRLEDDNDPKYIIGDVHELSTIFSKNKFDLIYADIPYSVEDAEHYGPPMVKRNITFNECFKVMKKGGFLVWLDQVLPQYKKSEFDKVGEIGLSRSTNHRFREITIFRKR